MTNMRQLVGTLAIAILVPGIIRAQGGSATNSLSPTAAVRDASSATNAPTPTPLIAPERVHAFQPARPQMTVPHPTQVEIPLATAPPPAYTAPTPRSRPTPLTPPTTQELLSKSMASGPGGSQTRLNEITPIQPALSLTNEGTATPGSGTLSLTNSPSGQPNIWQKNSPLLNGVDYHW